MKVLKEISRFKVTKIKPFESDQAWPKAKPMGLCEQGEAIQGLTLNAMLCRNSWIATSLRSSQ